MIKPVIDLFSLCNDKQRCCNVYPDPNFIFFLLLLMLFLSRFLFCCDCIVVDVVLVKISFCCDCIVVDVVLVKISFLLWLLSMQQWTSLNLEWTILHQNFSSKYILSLNNNIKLHKLSLASFKLNPQLGALSTLLLNAINFPSLTSWTKIKQMFIY